MSRGAIIVAVTIATSCGRAEAPAGSGGAGTGTGAVAAPPADAEARCRAFMKIPLRDLGPLEVVERCGPLFPPRCRAALATATVGQSIDDGLAIIRACAAEACPLPGQLLCGPRPSLSHTVHGLPGLARAILANPGRRITPGEDDIWRAAVGKAIARELVPLRAVVVRFEAAPTGLRATVNDGPAWELGAHATVADLRPLAAAVANAGGDAAGALIWGTHELGEDVRRAVPIALSQAGVMELVYCVPGGANCR